MVLYDPPGTLKRLATYMNAAVTYFKAGKAIPGPEAKEAWYDLAIAMPGGASDSYLSTKKESIHAALTDVEPLWDEL